MWYINCYLTFAENSACNNLYVTESLQGRQNTALCFSISGYELSAKELFDLPVGISPSAT
jgi:hypothetical protein